MIEITSQQYQVFGVGDSQQGGRPENQDDFDCTHTPMGFLVVLCDGMGGGPGGKTASYLAKTAFMRTLATCQPTASPITSIRMAVNSAEEAIELCMKEDPRLLGMGSTLAALLVTEQTAFAIHLGDSRVYQLRGKKMVFRTKDHSLVQQLQDGKALTEEQARTSPQSNVIMRGLGNTTNHVAEIEEIKYRQGDRFVLCSDGVWGCMPHHDLLERFTENKPTSILVPEIQSEIDHMGFAVGGGHDNHTLIMVETRGKVKSNSIWQKLDISKSRWIAIVLSVLLLISLLINVFCLVKVFGNNVVHFAQDIKTNKESSWHNDQIVWIETLRQHNDSLVIENIHLQMRIDSLLVALHDLSVQEKQGKSIDDTPASPTKTQLPPITLLDSTLRLVEKMRRNYDGIRDSIVHANTKRSLEATAMLILFNEKTRTEFSKEVNQVIEDLDVSKDTIILKTYFRKKDKKYTASIEASEKLIAIKRNIEKIRDNYNINHDAIKTAR